MVKRVSWIFAGFALLSLVVAVALPGFYSS